MDLFDYESYKIYESCLLDKIIETSLEMKRERVNELLGFIHIDVCGPRQHM